jgi:hypothetical protein
MSTTPKLAVLLPAVNTPKVHGGGHLNSVRFARLLAPHADVQLVSYEAREGGVPFLDDVEAGFLAEGRILVLTWGPDVTRLLARFHGRCPLVYYQRSIDWGIPLPADVPVICNSKYLLLWAQEKWPGTPLFYLPPVLESGCRNRGGARDIDVLVLPRKQPAYVLAELVPRLQATCRVHVQTDFVSRDELFALFNRSKVFLYAFAPMRSAHAPGGWRSMEGIANQVLEAQVCGCTVVSDVRGGHADFVEPWTHGYQLQAYSPAWDAEQVRRAIAEYPQPGAEQHAQRLLAGYGEDAFRQRAQALLAFLTSFFAFRSRHPPAPAAFGFPRPVTAWQRLRGRLHRLRKRL